MKQNYILLAFYSFFWLNGVDAQCPALTVSNASGPSQPICHATSSSLTATHNAESVVWYNAATNGTQLGTGSPFNTGPLSADTSFWAEGQSQGFDAAISGGGKPAKSSGNGSSTVVSASSPWGLAFTVNSAFRLNSVDVYLTSGTAGDVTVNLVDSGNNPVESVTLSVPAGGSGTSPVQYTLPLNWVITPGSYKIVTPTGAPAMNRDLAVGGYPYPIGSVGSITGGSLGATNVTATSYYFFYNWNYSPVVTCKSPRVEVAVQVKPAVGQPTGSASQTFTAGQTLADLAVTGTALSWYANSNGTTPLPDSTPLVNNTTYYVRQTVDGCTGTMLGVLVTEEVAGINDLVFRNLKAYPNPVKDKLYIANLSEITAAAVYNIQGQKVGSSNKETHEINFSGFAPGVYIVHLISGGQTKNIKVTKE
ncbi:MAG: T9SS type A sorting domain-containing protein [Flavobacterium sp.]